MPSVPEVENFSRGSTRYLKKNLKMLKQTSERSEIINNLGTQSFKGHKRTKTEALKKRVPTTQSEAYKT
jgi:hypothetical protein